MAVGFIAEDKYTRSCCITTPELLPFCRQNSIWAPNSTTRLAGRWK